MKSQQILQLLHWLRTKKQEALDDSATYQSRHDLKMHQALQYKAIAYQSVIDEVTSSYLP